MNALRHAACILLAVLFFTSPAYATSFSTDQSDLYYIVAEQGWGMQLVQRGSVIFATIFIYGPSGEPTWYTATLESTSNLTWTGALYATIGTYFGSPWNPAALTITQVGTMTWSAPMDGGVTVTYSVNGVTVTKNVVRQTLVLDNYNGTYLGPFHASATGCTNPASDVAPVDIPLATCTVSQTGSSISLTIDSAGQTITPSGALTQSGQFGSFLGTYTSSSGEVGNATVSGMNVQATAFMASFSLSSTNNGCLTTGYLVGMRTQ
jgi:hypothetical protein